MKPEERNKKHEEDKKREEDKRRKEQLTPIIDGDARPDINLNPEENVLRDHPIETPQDSDKKKTTTNRVDTDSLEDFKDAK